MWSPPLLRSKSVDRPIGVKVRDRHDDDMSPHIGGFPWPPPCQTQEEIRAPLGKLSPAIFVMGIWLGGCQAQEKLLSPPGRLQHVMSIVAAARFCKLVPYMRGPPNESCIGAFCCGAASRNPTVDAPDIDKSLRWPRGAAASCSDVCEPPGADRLAMPTICGSHRDGASTAADISIIRSRSPS